MPASPGNDSTDVNPDSPHGLPGAALPNNGLDNLENNVSLYRTVTPPAQQGKTVNDRIVMDGREKRVNPARIPAPKFHGRVAERRSNGSGDVRNKTDPHYGKRDETCGKKDAGSSTYFVESPIDVNEAVDPSALSFIDAPLLQRFDTRKASRESVRDVVIEGGGINATPECWGRRLVKSLTRLETSASRKPKKIDILCHVDVVGDERFGSNKELYDEGSQRNKYETRLCDMEKYVEEVDIQRETAPKRSHCYFGGAIWDEKRLSP